MGIKYPSLDPMEIKYISLDPGKTTGIAEWIRNGHLLFPPRDLNEEELDKYLLEMPKTVEIIVYEGFSLWKERNRQNDKLVTVQAIGKIKLTAKKNNILLVEQNPDVRKIAALWSGAKYPKGHMENWLSAYLHGYYYLHKAGIIPPRVLKDKRWT